MRKTLKTLMILAIGAFLAVTVAPVCVFAQGGGGGGGPAVPNELVFWDPLRAFNGYTVAGGIIFDMDGRQVYTYSPSSNVGIYPDGTIVRGTRIDGLRALVENDLLGNDVTVIPYQANGRTDLRNHHDVIKIWNNHLGEETIAAVMYREIDYDEAIAHGADPDNNISPGDTNITPDGIVEFRKDGTLIWEWNFWDHIVQNYDDTKLSFGDPADPANWGKLDINANAAYRAGIQRDWNHANSLDYNQTLDQFAINSREHGEFYIIDHSVLTFPSTAADFAADPVAATEANRQAAAGAAGDFLYRWGNPWLYGQSVPTLYNKTNGQQLFGPHDIQWIDEGLPGAGNFLIFDNGALRPAEYNASWVYEINPFISGLDANGDPIIGTTITREADAGYTGDSILQRSNQVVWEVESRDSDNNRLYSNRTSGAQRLPNGNTLICPNRSGTLVEVTQEGDVVWDHRGITGFRVYRYPYDYSGFDGLDFLKLGPPDESDLDGALDKFRDSKVGFDGDDN